MFRSTSVDRVTIVGREKDQRQDGSIASNEIVEEDELERALQRNAMIGVAMMSVAVSSRATLHCNKH
jgi:hypothetical protein